MERMVISLLIREAVITSYPSCVKEKLLDFSNEHYVVKEDSHYDQLHVTGDIYEFLTDLVYDKELAEFITFTIV